MGFESFGKRAKNAIRAAVLGSSIVSAGAAQAGERNMPPIPPTLDVVKKMQANDLANIEASKNALNAKVAADLAHIEASKNALNEKVAADLKMIDQKAKEHANSPKGQEEMRQLKKQFGLPENE